MYRAYQAHTILKKWTLCGPPSSIILSVIPLPFPSLPFPTVFTDSRSYPLYSFLSVIPLPFPSLPFPFPLCLQILGHTRFILLSRSYPFPSLPFPSLLCLQILGHARFILFSRSYPFPCLPFPSLLSFQVLPVFLVGINIICENFAACHLPEQYLGEIKNGLFFKRTRPEILLSESPRRFGSVTIQTKALIHTMM